MNLYRRSLNEVQRACLGLSLLRLEREKARQRAVRGAGPRKGHRSKNEMVLDDHHPVPKAPERANPNAAEVVGVSRQTPERVEAYRPFPQIPALELNSFNSDVTLLIAQYLECFEKLRANNVKQRHGKWWWVIESKPGEPELVMIVKPHERAAQEAAAVLQASVKLLMRSKDLLSKVVKIAALLIDGSA